MPRRRSVSATPASVGLRVYCLRPTLHLQLAIDYSPRLSDRPTGELRLRDGLGPSTCLQNIRQYKYSSGFSTDLASLKPFIYYIIYFIACHLLLVPLCYANHRTAKYCIHKKQYLRTKITVDEKLSSSVEKHRKENIYVYITLDCKEKIPRKKSPTNQRTPLKSKSIKNCVYISWISLSVIWPRI